MNVHLHNNLVRRYLSLDTNTSAQTVEDEIARMAALDRIVDQLGYVPESRHDLLPDEVQS